MAAGSIVIQNVIGTQIKTMKKGTEKSCKKIYMLPYNVGGCSMT